MTVLVAALGINRDIAYSAFTALDSLSPLLETSAKSKDPIVHLQPMRRIRNLLCSPAHLMRESKKTAGQPKMLCAVLCCAVLCCAVLCCACGLNMQYRKPTCFMLCHAASAPYSASWHPHSHNLAVMTRVVLFMARLLPNAPTIPSAAHPPPTSTPAAWNTVQKTIAKLAATHECLMRDVMGSLSVSALYVL